MDLSSISRETLTKFPEILYKLSDKVVLISLTKDTSIKVHLPREQGLY